MLSRLLGRAAHAPGTAVDAGTPGYTVHAAMLDGQDVRVFVAPHGTAAAIEVGEARATVLTGLAAGIVLSDIEEASDGPSDGLTASTVRERRLSAPGASRVIEAMPHLTDGQRDQLRAALAL